jgi:hypothetical protein
MKPKVNNSKPETAHGRGGFKGTANASKPGVQKKKGEKKQSNRDKIKLLQHILKKVRSMRVAGLTGGPASRARAACRYTFFFFPHVP